MNNQDILKTFIEKSNQNLLNNKKIMKLLKTTGIKEAFIFENFNLGFVDENVYQSIGKDNTLLDRIHEIGLYKNNKPIFNNVLIIPIYDERKTIINIVFCNPDTSLNAKCEFLNDNGIFNYNFLKNSNEIIFTKNPIESFLLIQANYHNTTFLYGDDKKYLDFFINNNIKKSTFTFEGKASLISILENHNILVDKIIVDFDSISNDVNSVEYLEKLFNKNKYINSSNENVIEIENGFVFSFPHITYRIIGNFYEHSISLKVNIKAIKNNDFFINSIDLYKNRERQNYIFNLMDKFNFRDHILLDNDFTKIIEVIENHKEKKQNQKHDDKIILTDHQKELGLSLLTNPDIIDEIENDITNLGYVRERKNKILAYLIMTSRLMDNPLHAIVTARTSSGKSKLVEIVELLCPKHDLKSISDISAQALYYVQVDELKNKFIVISEREGSSNSEYPLRELISKKSISKVVPLKDQVTGIIKTVTIKVNGPIALIETTSAYNEINPENLNRCFIISIDESEEQTKFIHDNQRLSDTLEGHLLKQKMNKIIEKHHNAQMLLKNINVFNPFAPLLTFPTQSIQTRRDNQKFLRLIKVICFLHQYQREVKLHKIDNNESLEYVECTLNDYKIAYELLIDGILDNSFDELSRPARELFEIIKSYLKNKSSKENIPLDKIIFTRKEIRDYSNWSFAQVRNNFQTLKEYEYLQFIQSKNGLAHSYRIIGNYSDSSNNNSILTPNELEDRINSNNLNKLNIPEYSGKN